jgi:hypothetical protein
MKNIFKKKPSAETLQKVSSDFSDKLENALKEFECDILRRTIKNLKTEISELRKRELSMRDFTASDMFIEISKTVSDPEKAAEDAYRAADAFMRIRDKGKSYQEDIVEKLKEIVSSSENNEELGTKVKLFITKL